MVSFIKREFRETELFLLQHEIISAKINFIKSRIVRKRVANFVERQIFGVAKSKLEKKLIKTLKKR